MIRYIAKRLLMLIPVLLGIVLVVFIMNRISPGNPARMLLGDGATDEAVAALSFIGLGVQPPTPEWGCMLSTAKQYITSLDKWYIVAFPGIMIMLTVFALNLFGDGLRDAFDPRSRS